MTYILYNPLADNRNGKQNAEKVVTFLQNDGIKYIDITKTNTADFIRNVADDERIILCGGDGTLFKFINEFGGKAPEHQVFYYPTGSGNDFMTDIMDGEVLGPVSINRFLDALPKVTVNGKESYFINGVGYGIDGYCCEVGDKMRESSSGKINYTAIAIKGLLFRFKPRNAVVTVDGKTHTYRHVWLAPTMNGRYYGGGMMVAPGQDRRKEGKEVSTVIFHCPGKLKTLMVFPSIFKGKHIEHKEMVEVLTGNEITVEFDRPTPLQIDGETVSGVTSYTVRTAAAANNNNIELEKQAAAV